MDQLLQDYSALFDYVYRYVRVRIQDVDICNDLVSEIFLKAVEKMHTYDVAKGTLKQWLTGITKFTLYNHWQRSHLTVSLDDLELGLTPDYHHLDFDQLLDRLPEHFRQLLIWRYVDDYTYEEIAKLIHKKPPAVRKYFSRLHEQLREQLQTTLTPSL